MILVFMKQENEQNPPTLNCNTTTSAIVSLCCFGKFTPYCQCSVGMFIEKALRQSVRDQLDGRADVERRHAVLRVRTGAPESALSQHALLKGTVP